jgi:hypothetical protein
MESLDTIGRIVACSKQQLEIAQAKWEKVNYTVREWTEKHKNDAINELHDLKLELLRKSLDLQLAQQEYAHAIETYELCQKNEKEDQICIYPAKESERSCSRSSLGSERDSSFELRLLLRDHKCVVTGAWKCQGAYIVARSLAEDYYPAWVKMYQRYCAEQDKGIHDVRNGLQLSHSLCILFERYMFTIVYANKKYQIKKSPYFPIPDLDEKEIQFNGDPSRHPSPEFLEYHNGMFEERIAHAREAIARTQDCEYFIGHYPEEPSQWTRMWIEQQQFERKRKWMDELNTVRDLDVSKRVAKESGMPAT